MSLPRHGPRKYARPSAGDEDADVALTPRVPSQDGADPGSAVGDAAVALTPGGPLQVGATAGGTVNGRVRSGPMDAARDELVALLELRGPPIRRDRGQAPSRRFADAAGRYVRERHHAYCVQYASRLHARHIELEDLVQACELGCFEALCRFDLEHPSAWKFLSYAKHWMMCMCSKLVHRDEPLVYVPEDVKRLRALVDDLVAAGELATDAGDGEVVAALARRAAAGGWRSVGKLQLARGARLDQVVAARSVSLSHDHRQVDERARGTRRALEEARQAAEDAAEGERRVASLAWALAGLSPLMRQAVWEAHGVGEDAGVPLPRGAALDTLRRLAERRLREEVEARE